jgi:hypothetical protein
MCFFCCSNSDTPVNPSLECNIDKPIDDDWVRKTGRDKSGNYQTLRITATNHGTTYCFSMTLTEVDGVAAILGMKALKNMIKHCTAENAKFIHERMAKYHEVPTLKYLRGQSHHVLLAAAARGANIKVSAQKVIGVVALFPGNEHSNGHPYTFTHDGHMFLFDPQEIDDTAYTCYTNGTIGYSFEATHKESYKDERGLPKSFDENRRVRAKSIFAQLNRRDATAQRPIQDASQEEKARLLNPEKEEPKKEKNDYVSIM